MGDIMNEYKSVAKMLDKKKKDFSFSILFKNLLFKVLVCVLLLLVGLIVLKIDYKSSKTIYKFIYETNFNFAKVNELYQEYVGDIIPFQSDSKKDIPVFSEDIIYKNLSIYKDGVSLEVGVDYLIPVLEDGIVVFIGEKEDYGNTIIIQQTDGVNVWYGNVTNVNVNLYDYVAKGEFLAASQSENIYFLFEKEGEYIDYKTYFK